MANNRSDIAHTNTTRQYPQQTKTQAQVKGLNRPALKGGRCQHKCLNKSQCGHVCCKDPSAMTGQSIRGVPEGYTPSKTREEKGIEAHIRTLKHKATTLPVQAAAKKPKFLPGGSHSKSLQQFAYQRPPSMKPSLHTRAQQQPQQTAPFRQNLPANVLPSLVKNIPDFSYGVGGRRIDQDPTQKQRTVQLNPADFDEEMNEGQYYQDDLEDMEDISMDEICNESDLRPHQDTATYRQHGKQIPEIDAERYDQLDTLIGSDESSDSVGVQQDQSAKLPSRHSSQHFSQDDWAELNLYQQDREAESNGDDERECYILENQQKKVNYPINSSWKSNSGRNPDMLEIRDHDMRNNSRFDFYEINDDKQSDISTHLDEQETRRSSRDFLASNSSDEDLCLAEEISSQTQDTFYQEDMYSRHNQNGALPISSNTSHDWKIMKSQAKSSVSESKDGSNLDRTHSSKSPGHRYGQVVAWVADSDSSPCSQKSNPKCKTPLFKKLSQKIDLGKSSSKPECEMSQTSNRERRKSIGEVYNSTAVFSSVQQPEASSFFHTFRAKKSEDMVETNGNIFAGVF